ncbi:MAG: mercury methylation corrinoid protein HgcA [Deltaproteobacteria bacterium]|nr:mercury methylation corrinoid protein HgcA [Deltaproteobacteria bacterium]
MNQNDPKARPKVMLPLGPASGGEGCGCSCGSDMAPQQSADRERRFVIGDLASPAGPLPRVSSSLTWVDHWGTIKARWGVGRMDYAIDPGLYALGRPGPESPVLVTANYKMSFDALRSALPGRDTWILVLDTQGINVWCAAGKGTFGTEEVVHRIAASRLKEVVTHRSLILPQLGAPGVAAHLVKQQSGFTVHYGPIAAGDLPAYLDGGGQATPAMRRKDFPLRERAVLIPVELVAALKPAALIAPLLFLSGGLGGPGGFWQDALREGTWAVFAFLSAVLAGTVLFPLLLPFLPGRAFTTKGLGLGILIALAYGFLTAFVGVAWLGMLAWFLMIPALTAYLAMNFTGCSTYTSPSGVNKEMRWALRLEIGLALGGCVLWIAARLVT